MTRRVVDLSSRASAVRKRDSPDQFGDVVRIAATSACCERQCDVQRGTTIPKIHEHEYTIIRDPSESISIRSCLAHNYIHEGSRGLIISARSCLAHTHTHLHILDRVRGNIVPPGRA